MKLWHHKTADEIIAEAMVDSQPKESPPPPPSRPIRAQGMTTMPYNPISSQSNLGLTGTPGPPPLTASKISGFHAARTGAIVPKPPFTLELYDEQNNLIKSVPLLDLIEVFENLEDLKAQLKRMEELYQEVLMATVEQTCP